MTSKPCPGVSCSVIGCGTPGRPCKCPPCGVCPDCRRRAEIARTPRPDLKAPTSPPDLDHRLF